MLCKNEMCWVRTGFLVEDWRTRLRERTAEKDGLGWINLNTLGQGSGRVFYWLKGFGVIALE